jgi:hypothetical protein
MMSFGTFGQVAPNDGWSDWESLDKPGDRDLSQPLAQKNADGHLEVFAPGTERFAMMAGGGEQ